MIDWGLVVGLSMGCALGTGAGYYGLSRSIGKLETADRHKRRNILKQAADPLRSACLSGLAMFFVGAVVDDLELGGSGGAGHGILKYLFCVSVTLAQYLYLRSVAKSYPDLIASQS